MKINNSRRPNPEGKRYSNFPSCYPSSSDSKIGSDRFYKNLNQAKREDMSGCFSEIKGDNSTSDTVNSRKKRGKNILKRIPYGEEGASYLAGTIIVGTLMAGAAGIGFYSKKDSDGDGIENYREWIGRTEYRVADTDQDGLDDGEEINKYGTDPLDENTDGDYLNDAEEARLFPTDPTSYESMGDVKKLLEENKDGKENAYLRLLVKNPETFQEVSGRGNLTKNGNIDENEVDYVKKLVESSPNLRSQILEEDYHIDGSIDDQELELMSDPDADGIITSKEKKIGTDPHNKDTDSDGLLDEWEVYGVKREGFDSVPLDEYGADPLHKDIFVEVSGGELPTYSKINVEDVFENAPVSNPDSEDGIDLHIDDDSSLNSLGGKNMRYKGKGMNKPLYPELLIKENSPRFGSFYFLKLQDFKNPQVCGRGTSPGFTFSIDNDYSFYPGAFVHEIGHNILGKLDSKNQYGKNVYGNQFHSKYPEHSMHPTLNRKRKPSYHPDVWNEIERDGILGLPGAVLISGKVNEESWEIPE